VNNNNAAVGAVLIALLCVGVVLLGILALYIFFCLTLQRTMSEVRPRNRTIAPGLVWLHLLHLGSAIPFVGIVVGIAASVWDLIMVLKIGTSLKQEFEDRGWRTDGEGFGRIIGLIWTVGQLATLPVGLVMNIVGPQFGDPAIAVIVGVVLIALGLTIFICWIVYWIQMASYGRRLREGKRGYRRGGIEEDFDDEYRPSRRRYDEDDDEEEEFGRRRRDDDDEDRGGFDFNRRSRRGDDEYEEDDDRPRRRSRDDD
jgi:hypothetical protein